VIKILCYPFKEFSLYLFAEYLGRNHINSINTPLLGLTLQQYSVLTTETTSQQRYLQTGAIYFDGFPLHVNYFQGIGIYPYYLNPDKRCTSCNCGVYTAPDFIFLGPDGDMQNLCLKHYEENLIEDILKS